jgi:subtilase-type serine protease
LNGANTLTSAVEVQGGRFLLNGSLVSTALTTTGGVSTVSASGVLKDSNLVVNGGVVSFNGTQTGGTTTVGANGLLKGVGTLGNTRVDGIIAPGNSIGTLTINGNYVQGATGVYAAELAPGGAATSCT